jgi:hypothetical protein
MQETAAPYGGRCRNQIIQSVKCFSFPCMLKGMSKVVCLFCRKMVSPRWSRLDVPGESPDYHLIDCDCGLKYHVDGSTATVSPDVSGYKPLRAEIEKANEEGVDISVHYVDEKITTMRHAALPFR